MGAAAHLRKLLAFLGMIGSYKKSGEIHKMLLECCKSLPCCPTLTAFTVK